MKGEKRLAAKDCRTPKNEDPYRSIKPYQASSSKTGQLP